MKNRQLENHSAAPRRRVLGAVAGAVAGLVGLKLSGRKSTVSPLARATEASPTTEPVARAATKLVVKPAPNSVKRHG
jgi:hypothetical protein